jgi:hypothetical protein
MKHNGSITLVILMLLNSITGLDFINKLSDTEKNEDNCADKNDYYTCVKW